MKNIVFCASDAGGANNLIPVIRYMEHKSIVFVLGSSKTKPMYARAGIEVLEYEISSIEKAVSFLTENDFSCVICGTSILENQDRFLIFAANKLGVRSVAILDEWYNYRSRFVDKNKDLIYLPDVICCQDENSKQRAIKEGLPKEKLYISGSVYLSTVSEAIKEFKKNNKNHYKANMTLSFRTIVFISETHAADYGEDEPGGPFGQFLGYNEKTVRKDIFEILEKNKIRCVLMEKLHPNHSDAPSALLSDYIDWKIIKDGNLWEMFLNADLIIGMRSIALLEAAMFGKHTVSYQPNLKTSQLCAAVNLGLIPFFKESVGFEKWIKNNMQEDLDYKEACCSFSFVREDVFRQIEDIILSN